MQLRLSTLDPEMAAAWKAVFAPYPAVIITTGSILEARADAIVSPANSFGFMDGGIDLAYSHHFGWELEQRLKDKIKKDHAGELPVGCAVVVETLHSDIPFLVSAPTMRVPGGIANSVNVYLAFRAVFLAIRSFKGEQATQIRSVLSPALGAGIGGMPFGRVARQMHAAYAEIVLGDAGWRDSARSILAHHGRLLE